MCSTWACGIDCGCGAEGAGRTRRELSSMEEDCTYTGAAWSSDYPAPCVANETPCSHAEPKAWRAHQFLPTERAAGLPRGWRVGMLLTPPMASVLLMPGTSLQHASLQRTSPHSLLRPVSRCCSRARVPLLSEESDAQMATQAVAWFDEVSMLQVFYMGDLRHDVGAADADAIEAAIVESGGNVSRYLTPEERTLPQGGDAALAALEVGFSVEISDSDSDAAMPPRQVRLRVCFTQVQPRQHCLIHCTYTPLRIHCICTAAYTPGLPATGRATELRVAARHAQLRAAPGRCRGAAVRRRCGGGAGACGGRGHDHLHSRRRREGGDGRGPVARRRAAPLDAQR